MTREDAIEILKQDIPYEHDFDLIDAINMAIKVLKQEPDAIHNEREQAYMKGYEDASKRYRTEPCEDAISRHAAIEIIQGWLDHDMGYSWEEKNIMRCAIVELENLPSVNQQESKYCDRNICIKNEYNGISCDECEVTKSQEPQESEV